MKRYFLLFLVVVIFLTSCTSTKDFVSPIATSDELTIEEKLIYYGGKPVLVDLEEAYFDGSKWLDKAISLINEAEDYILLSTFLGSSSPSLEPLYSALESKAKEGVRVYLIIDGSSNLDMTETRFVMTPLNYLRESGVELLIYAPFSFTHIINPSSLIVRDHRKMMIVDGQTAVLGGMNINYISMGSGDETQRDSMYVFSSPSLCKLLLSEFVTIWNESSVVKIDEDSFYIDSEENGGEKAWLFNRNVFSSDVSISGMFGSLINEAEESIFLCPYLPATDEYMNKALKNAVDRGVDTQIWSSLDSRGYAKSGGIYAISNLISETDATYYDVSNSEDGETYPLFHMKVLIIDDRYIVIGSTNFNYRSMNLSHEVSLVIDSTEIAKMVKENVKEVAGNPVLVTKEMAEEDKRAFGSFLSYLFTYFGG